jgi:hypothetical protein
VFSGWVAAGSAVCCGLVSVVLGTAVGEAETCTVELAAGEAGTSVALPEPNIWHEKEASSKTIMNTKIWDFLFVIVSNLLMIVLKISGLAGCEHAEP